MRRSILAAAGLTGLMAPGCVDSMVEPDPTVGDDGDGDGDGGSADDDGESGDEGDTGATSGGSVDGGSADDGDDGTPPPVMPTCATSDQIYGDALICFDDVANCGLCLDGCMAQAEAVLAEQGEWTCGGWEFGGVTCSEVIGNQCCQVVQLNDLGCAGRPFEVHGQARVAEVASRPDWSAELVPGSLAVLSRSDRRALAAYWRSVGLAEHASVASFARFTLDLMSMGAPASLLRSCQRAAADEVEHARLAFALASAYAGDPVGPGRFDPGAMSERSEVQIVVSAVIEGCVEETLSAALAAVAASQTTDETVAAVLRKIARDEERHAALAWSFVRWVADARPDLHDAIDGAFIAAIAAADEGSRAAAHDRPGLSAHGRLDGDVRRATIRATLRGVVDPARRAVVMV